MLADTTASRFQHGRLHRHRVSRLAGLCGLGAIVMLTLSATGGLTQFADNRPARPQRQPREGVAANSVESALLGAGVADWGTIASSGMVDEGDRDEVVFAGATAAIKSSLDFASSTVRFNIVATDEFKTSLADGFTLAIRFRDNGPSAMVKVWLKELNVLDGSVETIASFNSNHYVSAPGYRLAEIDVCGMEWDFFNNVYYLETRLQKSSDAGNPGLSTIQINQIFCD